MVSIKGAGPGYHAEVEIEAVIDATDGGSGAIAAREYLEAWRELYRQTIQPAIRAIVAEHFPSSPATEPGAAEPAPPAAGPDQER